MHPKSYENVSIREDILATLRKMEPYAEQLGSMDGLRHLEAAAAGASDAGAAAPAVRAPGQRGGDGACGD